MLATTWEADHTLYMASGSALWLVYQYDGDELRVRCDRTEN